MTSSPPSGLPSGLGPWCVGVRVVVRHRLPDGRATDVLGELREWGATTLTVQPETGPPVVVDRRAVVAGKPVPPRPSPRLRVTVAEAERHALAGWPPVEREELGGWTLRASDGYSARGNSALAVGDPGVPWAQAVRRVAAFYRARALPPWVQSITGSPEQERLLGEGWTPARPGEADTSFHLTGVSRAARTVRALLPAVRPDVEVTGRLTDAWLADDARAAAHPTAAAAVLAGPPEVGFASVTERGVVVAKGRAGLADGWVGLTDVRVSPAHRRRGLAVAVVHALLGWAAERGATTAYLQVRDDNTAALALYERLGFTRHHRYRYLAAPASLSGP